MSADAWQRRHQKMIDASSWNMPLHGKHLPRRLNVNQPTRLNHQCAERRAALPPMVTNKRDAPAQGASLYMGIVKHFIRPNLFDVKRSSVFAGVATQIVSKRTQLG
jgi:hypothetical protein